MPFLTHNGQPEGLRLTRKWGADQPSLAPAPSRLCGSLLGERAVLRGARAAFRCEGRRGSPAPAAAPPRPRLRGASSPHSSESCGRTFDPRHRGRRCSGVPRCACACGSASDCSTTSVVSPPPAPVRSWPRAGTLSLGKWWDCTDARPVGGRGPRDPWARGETGLRATNSDPGRSTESRAGLAGVRKGRGRAAGQPSSVEMGSRLHSTVYGSAPLDPGPFALHPQPGSFACLHAFLRSRAPHYSILRSARTEVVPQRRSCSPRRVVVPEAHFPATLVCARDQHS